MAIYRFGARLALLMTLAAGLLGRTAFAQGDPAEPTVPHSLVHHVRETSERMEMTVNTSRILTMDRKIPQAQVNNPDLLDLTPLAPNQIQVSAKKPGVTQVNLWDDQQQIYAIDVIVYGDAQELTMLLRAQFPSAALKVVPVVNGVLISGYVDQPDHVHRIVEIAEEYYDKVINNIAVGGVQQVLLHVRVMEVSRTKLNALGLDFSQLSGPNSIAVSGASVAPVNATVSFDVFDGGNAFFGVLEALRQDQLMKILSEPTLVTISGRPASFNVGGAIPILRPGDLGQPPSYNYEDGKFGTSVKFVPIVLGNGRIRLEIESEISELDQANAVTVGGFSIPAKRSRDVNTSVEMMAGQTLALAGLVQTRTEARRRGIPWVSDAPYLGALFRRVHEENNEVELLILVTPELVEPLNPHEVPLVGPGMSTESPSDWQLFMRGHIEVPRRCSVCSGRGCTRCTGSAPHVPGAVLEEGLILDDRPPLSARRPHAQGSARSGAAAATDEASPPGLIGPMGYDVVR